MKLVVWGSELSAWVGAATLANAGHQVTLACEQTIDDPIAAMGNNIANEPGLSELVQQQVTDGNLMLVAGEAVLQAQMQGQVETHILSFSPDEFNRAEKVLTDIVAVNDGELVIINQSHFGVGASTQLEKLLRAEKNQKIIYFAENTSEGMALEGYRNPSSIILGGDEGLIKQLMQTLFNAFTKNLDNLSIMGIKEAELSKLSITGMLALRIGFINELANLGEELNIDIDVVRRAMGADKRIGKHYLSPGCGFGGSSFPKTLNSLAKLLSENAQSPLVDTILKENEKQKELPFRKLWKHYQCDIRHYKIAIWGASFKPGSASIEGASSLKIIDAILAQQAKVIIHDPEALQGIAGVYKDEKDVSLVEDKYQALAQADALILVTEWPEYASADFERVKSLMKEALIIDGRNLFNRKQLETLGFCYYAIGR